MPVSAVNILIDSMLPEDLRDPKRLYDKKGVGSLLSEVAKRYPESYAKLAKAIGDIGQQQVWDRGETFRLKDFKPVIDRKPFYDELDKREAEIKKTVLDPAKRKDALGTLYGEMSDRISKATNAAALAQNNNIAITVLTGARGKDAQLRDLLSTPGFYTDGKMHTIPGFIRQSYAEGLRPADYLAGTYGARNSVTHCLLEGTEVRMADGTTKEIQDLRPGDWVVGADATGATFPVEVKHLFDQGLQEVWEYALRFSNSNKAEIVVRATEEHKMLMTDSSVYGAANSRFHRGQGPRPDPASYHATGIQKLGKLGRGGRKAVLPAGGAWTGSKKEPMALLLGLLIGDGCLTAASNRFSCADPLLIDHIAPYLESLELKISKDVTDDLKHYSYGITRANYTPQDNGSIVKGQQGFVKGARTPLNQVLESYGLRGKYSWEKTLPADIWSWDDESVLALIAGYFACDGTVSTGVHRTGNRKFTIVAFSSTSRRLVEGLKDLLMVRFGISAGRITKNTSGGFKKIGETSEERKRPCYTFSIGRTMCVQKFATLVSPLTPGVKRDRLITMAFSISLKDNNPFPKASLAQKRHLGILPCWDIEVDHPDHLFVLANNLIVSNSKRMTAKGGFYGKTLGRAAATTYVTEKDCGTSNGIALPMDEKDIRGRVLQRETAGMPAGTVIDRKTLERLKDSGEEQVIVRSPMTCQSEHGICAKCYGVKSSGKLPKVGDHVGYTSAQAASEPIVQGALCIVERTRVRMADLSVREIQTLQPGEWVLGADKLGNTFPVEVTALWDQGLQDCHRFEFRPGSTQTALYFEGTKGHKMLLNKKNYGAVPDPNNFSATILPAGYKHSDIAAVLPTSCYLAGLKAEPYAALCGVMLGDGIHCKEAGNHTPRLSCADPLLVTDLNDLLAPTGCRLVKEKRSFDYSISRERSEYLKDTRSKNPVKQLLGSWALLDCYAGAKRIPAAAWLWDDRSLGALIGGYLAADGSVVRTKAGQVSIQFGSTSKALLKDVKTLMAVRFGVYASAIHLGGKGGTGRYVNDVWTVSVSRLDQVQKLSKVLGRIPGVKGQRLLDYLSEARYSPRHTEYFYRASRKRISPLGQLHCWDITVDHPDHLFVLENGLIVSNSMKHVTSASGPKTEFSGLEYLNQVAESPEEFKDRAVVSKHDGKVDNIREAPQGGQYVTVNGEDHYVAPDRFINVQKGQTLEAGDALTDGLMDPEDVMTYKGLGAARSYWADTMAKISKASGADADRRVFETIARAAVDHVDLDDPIEEGFLPDDRVRYSQYVLRRTPPKNVVELPASKAVGQYLEAPALHHTVGTRVTASMADDLAKKGFPKLQVSPNEPGFRPSLVRLTQVASTDDDWLASLGGSYLGNQLREGITRAQDTNIEKSWHPVPRLAVGEGYADKLEETGQF